jgi:probable phosphoglycerate mutase
VYLLLARHGETEWNVERRIQGWGNSSLTERGRDQARALSVRLKDTPIMSAYCSDSGRAIETAQLIVADRDIPLHTSDLLRETSWGLWEGKTAAEIEASDPELWRQFIARGSQMSAQDDSSDWESETLVPGGDTLRSVNSRITKALHLIQSSSQCDDDRILVVGHGGSLRVFLTLALDLPPRRIRRWHLDNASLTHIYYPKGHPPVIQKVNDTGHYGGGL